jgi:C4-type Zn-finger protein
VIDSFEVQMARSSGVNALPPSEAAFLPVEEVGVEVEEAHHWVQRGVVEEVEGVLDQVPHTTALVN